MAEGTESKRLTISIPPAEKRGLDLIETETGLNTTDSIRASIRLGALVAKLVAGGGVPGVRMPDGQVVTINLPGFEDRIVQNMLEQHKAPGALDISS